MRRVVGIEVACPAEGSADKLAIVNSKNEYVRKRGVEKYLI